MMRFLIFTLLLLNPSIVFATPSIWDICRKLFRFGIFQTADPLKDRENGLTKAVGINEVSSEGLAQETTTEIEKKSADTIKQERQALENEYIHQLNEALNIEAKGLYRSGLNFEDSIGFPLSREFYLPGEDGTIQPQNSNRIGINIKVKGLNVVRSRLILPEKLKELKERYAAALEAEAALQPDIEITEESLARFINPEEKTMSGVEVREKYGSAWFSRFGGMSSARYINGSFSPFQSQLFRVNGTLQYVIKNSNGAKLYHGSGSSSLLAFTATHSRGGLRGVYELKDLPSGSKKAYRDEKDTIPNGFHLSTVKITDLGVAINYSEWGQFRVKFVPSGVEFSERDLGLINDMFPVIYGLQPKVKRTINPIKPDGTLRGEGFSVDVQMVGGVNFDEIVAVFVPANKIRLVEDLIADLSLSHTIKVSPIEPIQEVFEKIR